MRLRYKPWAKEKLEQYPQYVISAPEELKGKWETVYEQVSTASYRNWDWERPVYY